MVFLNEALEEWKKCLGPERVLADASSLDRYSRSTSPKATRPAAIILPKTTEEVVSSVRIAHARGVAVYPISRGKNWGYGDACAVTDGQVIMDLSRMNRIVEVNRDLAYAVIEPGVSQGELAAYLKQNNLPFWLDVTGAGPEASIVGNILERGFGHTPYGDKFMASAGYEIVLADGRVLKTGFGHFDNIQTASVFKHGVGPALDGIFTQSNLGIVTRMTIWLMPKPEYFLFYALIGEKQEDIVGIVDAIKALRLSGALTSTVHIANDLRVLSQRMQYPWSSTDQTPLPEHIRTRIRSEQGIGMWNGAGAMYGTRAIVAAQKKSLDRALKGKAKLVYLDDAKLKMAETILSVLRRFGWAKTLYNKIQHAKIAYRLLQGEPVYQTLSGAAWRSKTKVDPQSKLDPLENHWGFMWFSPILTAEGARVHQYMGIVEAIFSKYKFEPLVTLSSINPRALCCVMTVAYDKSNPEEERRAAQCYKELADQTHRMGYREYRLGIQSMGSDAIEPSVFRDVASSLKTALDPQNILAPGRYHLR